MRAVPLLMLAFACQLHSAQADLTSAQEKLLPVIQFNRLTTADGLLSSSMVDEAIDAVLGFGEPAGARTRTRSFIEQLSTLGGH